MNYKPVPKVIAQTTAGLITAIIVAALDYYGVGEAYAAEIGTSAGVLIVAFVPVAIGAVAGYMKRDTERDRLYENLRQYDTR